MKQVRVTHTEKTLEWLRIQHRRHYVWLLPLVSGFLLGALTNIVTDMQVQSVSHIWQRLFPFNHPLGVLWWSAVGILVGWPFVGIILDKYHRRRRYEDLLAQLARSRIDPIVSPFISGSIGWGSGICLQVVPDLTEGWTLSKIEVDYDGGSFQLPERYKVAYAEYCQRYLEEKRLFDDGDRVMLQKNPKAFSDTPTLKLSITATKYSIVQFYRDNVATIQSERNALIHRALDGDITFPHALCMHAVVTTTDDKVLLTLRSPKVDYYPYSWSVSVEEQLQKDDLYPYLEGTILRWGRRLLWEELGLPESECDEANIRVLAIFLEADILNCSLLTWFKLNLSATELGNIIAARPRTDYEFTKWKFLSYDELILELKSPSDVFHATSGLRMYLTLAKRFGAPRLADKMFRI